MSPHPSRSSTCSSFSSTIINSSLATISSTGKLDSVIQQGLSSRVIKALKKLEEFDTVIVVDNMRSMADHRFKLQTILHVLAPLLAKYDQDGFDLHLVFKSQPEVEHGAVQAENMSVITSILDTLSHCGSEPGRLFDYLDKLVKSYIERYADAPESTKPVNYIVITNGDFPVGFPRKPNCMSRAGQWLASEGASSKRSNQIGFQFVQVCTSVEVQQIFERLDNDFDFVDTSSYEDSWQNAGTQDIVKVLLGGIDKNVDQKGAAGVYKIPLPWRELCR